MFPLIGILVAAGLLFKLKGSSQPEAASTPKPTVPTKGTTSLVKPRPSKPRTTAPVKPSTGAIQGFNLPLVLSPNLPIGQYNPKTNSVESPPYVGWGNTISSF